MAIIEPVCGDILVGGGVSRRRSAILFYTICNMHGKGGSIKRPKGEW